MDKNIDLSRYWYIFRGGIAAPFFSWFGVFLLVMVFYTLNASAQMMGEITWQQAIHFATGWWATSFGGAVDVSGVAVTLMPLTLTFIVIYVSYYVWRPREIATWLEVFAAAVSWPVVVTIACLVLQAPGDWWFALIGSFILAGATALWTAREALLYNLPVAQYIVKLWPRLRWLLWALMGLPLVVTIVSIAARIGTIKDIHEYYLAGIIGSIGLILIQLAYLPVLIIWFYSWLIGAGFSVGAETNFTIFGVHSGPLPAIPMFGAFPRPGQSMIWLFVVLILVMIVYGAIVQRRTLDEDVPELIPQLIELGAAIVASALVASGVSFLATGAIGPGRMAITGPNPALSAGMTIVVIGLPFIVGHILAHPLTKSFLQSKIRRAEPELSAEPAGNAAPAENAAPVEIEGNNND